MTRKTPCERYEQGATVHGNALDADYYAAAAADVLPREQHREDWHVAHGYAVGIGRWYFFPAIEPAVTFGRSARMSYDCTGYGVYAAAHEVMHCPHHGDERLLLVTGESLDRSPGEVAMLARFVESLRRNPDSSRWHPLRRGTR